MALHEDRRFARAVQDLPQSLLQALLHERRSILNTVPWAHCGYATLGPVLGVSAPRHDVSAGVDNAFRLGPSLGFERVPFVITTGLRTSRFASVLFWEVLHALAPSGVWVDIDEAARCGGTALGSEDYLQREYFRGCLRLESREKRGLFSIQTFRKTSPTRLAAHIDDNGWTFGILTSGASAQAARMAAALLDLHLPKVEVIFCGPRPTGGPFDDRIRAIDLEQPEPRGWITRKKNAIADAAQYDNLCLLHDRYVITPRWAKALTDYGPCYAFLTLPQVYYAGKGQLFPQRYPDYQLLKQRQGLARAFAARIYDSERVFHPQYDDFADTAFCCGGLYIARRCLWNMVRQDEALYHCEWEDISFGLDCQRRGLPHRVNPLIVAESSTPHPLLLTRLHTLQSPDRAERGRVHVTSAQQTAAQTAPQSFKPVIPVDRERYYDRIRERFNAIEGLSERDRLPHDIAAGCRGLADFWAAIERHVATLNLTTRSRIAAIGFFLSDTVYKWPAPQVQSWIRRHEDAQSEPVALTRFTTVAGWGTGSAFQSAHRLIGRDLAFVVDSNPATWGSVVNGVEVRPPAAIRDLDPTTSAIVVFSCFLEDIRLAIRAQSATLAILPAFEVVAGRRFQPLVDLAAYYEEVERYYPVLFQTKAVEAAA